MKTHEQQTVWLLQKLISIMIRVEEQLQRLNNRSHHIMATLQEVKDEIESLKTRVSDEVSEVAGKVQVLVDEIQSLKDAAQNGTVVTPEQLDELVTSLKSIGEAVEAISGAEAPAEDPPVVEEPAPFSGR